MGDATRAAGRSSRGETMREINKWVIHRLDESATQTRILRADVFAALGADALTPEERSDMDSFVAALFNGRESISTSAALRILRGTTLLRDALLRSLGAT